MNVPAILEALEDCPGLIANKLTDGRGYYCAFGWLMFKAGIPVKNSSPWIEKVKLMDRFGFKGLSAELIPLIDFNNRPYRSRKARLEAVRAFVAAQGLEE